MNVYFSAVGGVGIGPLAMLAKDVGFKVSGSDLKESDMFNALVARGIDVAIGQDGSHIANLHSELNPIEWFVYSSAVTEENPELIFARENGIKVSKRDEFLNFLITEKNMKMVAVAGTHGKTTTSAMITWILREMNQQISYSIGSKISFGPSAQYQTGSKYFIYECDEFDRNFLNFNPFLSLIVSVDYDHPDTYPTVKDYKDAFNQFTQQSETTILWKDAADYLQLKPSEKIKLLDQASTSLESIKLIGEQMRRNAYLATVAVWQLMPEQNLEILISIVNQFPGTSRRFEKLSENIYTDYAHHPVEIAATINMAKEVNQNVVVIYQPHQNIRQHEIVKENAYKHCFEQAKKVYWLPTYLSREDKNLAIISPTQLLNATSPETNAEFSEMNDTLWHKIKNHQKNGDLVVAMSAGDLDEWLRERVSV